MRKKKKWNPPRIKVKYPKWSYVYNIDNRRYYLVLTKVKKEFVSERAFKSWKVQAIQGTNESLSGYANYGKIGFRPGTLVKSMSGNIFYISDENKRHLVTTPDLFLILGFSYDIQYISNEELTLHEEGDEINDIRL